MEPGANVAKIGNISVTSNGRKSRKTEKIPIDRKMRLRIIQQDCHDYEQDGGAIQVVSIEGGTAIVLMGVSVDEHGSLFFEHGNEHGTQDSP